MKTLRKKIRNKKGFTLAELLIVVAIIAVLVAVSIPIFTTQLEKARDATTVANLRAAYAEATVQILDETVNAGNAATKKVTITGVVCETTDDDLGAGEENLDFSVTGIDGKGKYTVEFDFNNEDAVTAAATIEKSTEPSPTTTP